MLAAGCDMAAPSAELRQRRAAARDGAPQGPERDVAEPAGGEAGSPLPGTFWLTRIVLLRSIALLYCECPGAARGAGGGPAEPRADGVAGLVATQNAGKSRGCPVPRGLPRCKASGGALLRGAGEPPGAPAAGAGPPVGSEPRGPWWERRPGTGSPPRVNVRVRSRGLQGASPQLPGPDPSWPGRGAVSYQRMAEFWVSWVHGA